MKKWDTIYTTVSECMIEGSYLGNHILQEGHHTLHVRLLSVTAKKKKKHLWTNSPSLCQFSHSCSHDNTDTRSSCKRINTSCFLMKYKETADICPYVAACARTRTPPAQRLGLRGESDAILSSVCFYPGKVRRDTLT